MTTLAKISHENAMKLGPLIKGRVWGVGPHPHFTLPRARHPSFIV